MLDLFLTAYDPSDLPGGSIDPLGFERGYLFLADKILPGMTNVANCPRYFGVLCAGSLLADVPEGTSQREERTIRQDAILRMERLWALANVLYAKNETSLPGLRGITYAQRQLELIQKESSSRSTSEYKLLARQARYGAIGIYGAVAEGVKLLFRSTYELTPGFGIKLAEAFLTSTKMPDILRRAVREEGDVSINTTREWGERAYMWGDPSEDEKECFANMIHSDIIRSKFAMLLKEVPFKNPNEMELDRLSRVAKFTEKKTDCLGLKESSEYIILYENCYSVAILGLERLLYLAHANGGGVSKVTIKGDLVLKKVARDLPNRVKKLNTALAKSIDPHFQKNTEEKLRDVIAFVNEAAEASSGGNLPLVDCIVRRHTDIQHGKYDNGRRKMAWVQWQDDVLTLTMARGISTSHELTSYEEINPHPYRLQAADEWIKAAEL